MATILCINDDPRILELHVGVLGGCGYKVLTALDGLTGLAMSRNHLLMLSCSILRWRAWTETQSLRSSWKSSQSCRSSSGALTWTIYPNR
jgi:DNA-binding response OmpR family regulator